MGLMVFIVIATLAVSLYDFFVSRNWQQLTSRERNDKVFEQRNKKYGAYAIRKSYNTVLSVIILCMIVLSGTVIGVEKGFGFGPETEMLQPQKMDTMLLTINAPPLDPIETLPPSYKIENSGSGKPSVANPNPEPPQEEVKPEPKEIPENATAGSESPATSGEKPIKTKSKNKASSVEEQVKEYERSLFENASGVKERERIKQKAEEDKQKREQQKARNTDPNKSTTTNQGGSKPSEGAPMVNWDLKDRTPHQNNAWFVRNPGYTCGKGAGGTVLVKIKVNANGDVTTASLASNAAGLNPCLVDQALKYAKMSRFNAASTASQEGTITYIFSPQ